MCVLARETRVSNEFRISVVVVVLVVVVVAVVDVVGDVGAVLLPFTNKWLNKWRKRSFSQYDPILFEKRF